MIKQKIYLINETNIYQYAVDDIITFNNLLYAPLENKISLFSPSHAKLAM